MTADRLRRLEPVQIDGALYWETQKVCDALQIGAIRARALKKVPLAHRSTMVVKIDRWTKKRVSVIDREGVEILLIEYGREPRHQLLAAVDETAMHC